MESMEHKILAIGRMFGQRVIFTIGVDAECNRIDLLQVDVCAPKKPEKKEPEQIPEYIG